MQPYVGNCWTGFFVCTRVAERYFHAYKQTWMYWEWAAWVVQLYRSQFFFLVFVISAVLLLSTRFWTSRDKYLCVNDINRISFNCPMLFYDCKRLFERKISADDFADGKCLILFLHAVHFSFLLLAISFKLFINLLYNAVWKYDPTAFISFKAWNIAFQTHLGKLRRKEKKKLRWKWVIAAFL